ncbi:lipid-A-disaccharide synthase [Aureimonas endophytica]|uniref:Lipid-A-disaccharide synthase n=1 Tax=Aureimonas endophytica TaxID=2027858 RepID=A0A917E015_9HYPH|nr:lipid-A-disaccharide synthase [Aureimonas endophytica]GGD89343.1 lipid-A-disaccharide synthase [Aureimonas endophytica]
MTRIAFVVGENSSDRLGAELIRGLRRRLGSQVEAIGLGGDEMAKEGVASLFDIDELSIIGIGAVLSRLPQLLRRLHQMESFIVTERPDALVVIDNYAFSHRVARRVRRRLPDLPIINYVPPAVWAYHGERAAAMTAYIDRVVSVFPFEPEAYRALGGPDATYVGHPLVGNPALRAIMEHRRVADGRPKPVPTLLLLPGSRSGEVDRLLDDFGATLALLKQRLPELRALLPAVPRLEAKIRDRVARFEVKPEIVSGEAAKWQAFAAADAALAASGTVALELALAGVPMALCYRLDPISYRFRHWMTGWTAALPNYVAGHPLVPEHFHETVRPEHLARRLERLLTDTPERRAQVEGLRLVAERMQVEKNPGDMAAGIVVDELARRRGRMDQPR